jgi:peptidoglycan/xylan/chitin deacetylase (PgdA/CDA1 family)
MGYWMEASAAAAAAFGGFMSYAVRAPSSRVFGPSLVRADVAGSSRVAVTFDDGPSESTPCFLDILAEFDARATFFQVGTNALRLREVAQRVGHEGHEIGNHTEHHPRFYRCTPREIAGEIESCQQSLESVHGRRPALFRPPYGVRWFGLHAALGRCGLRSVMWSVSSHDWDHASEWVAKHVIDSAAPGDVILMHDGETTIPGDRRQGSARALRVILSSFRTRGIAAVTVSELFGIQQNA